MIQTLKAQFEFMKRRNKDSKVAQKIDSMINLLNQPDVDPQKVMNEFEQMVLMKSNNSKAPVRRLIMSDPENRRLFSKIQGLKRQNNSDCGC